MKYDLLYALYVQQVYTTLFNPKNFPETHFPQS